MTKLVGVAASAALCLVLAACGGGTSSNTNTAGDAGSSQPPATMSDTSSAPGAAGAWTSAQCAEVAASMAAAMGGVGPQTGATDPSNMSDFLRKVSAGAPADLQGDFTTVADGLQKFYATLAAAGIDLTDPSTYSSQSAAAKVATAGQQLQVDIGDAAKHIESRLNEICGGSN
jgi:hypothetical protein